MNLLILLETSPQAKKEKFLALIAEESVAWADEIKKKMITFESILSWDTSALMEFLPNMPERILASAVWNHPPEKRELVFKALPLQMRRKVEEQFTGNPPAGNEIVACQLRMITEARQSAQKGAIRFDKFAPGLAVPEDIEEILLKNEKGGAGQSVNSSSSSKKDPFEFTTSTSSYTYSDPIAQPVATNGAHNQSNLVYLDEIRELRKRIVGMGKDLESLERENNLLKNKIEQIKKIV